MFEKLEDAAEVHRLTGSAPSVALHFPWDAVDDYAALRAHAVDLGLGIGAVNPNLFQDPMYKLGSITHPDPEVRRSATDHLLECVEIASELGSTAQSLWLADGTNYAGQDNLIDAPRSTARMPARAVRRAARRSGAAGRVQAVRAGVLRDRHRRLGLGDADLPGPRRREPGCSSISATTCTAPTSSRSLRCWPSIGRLGGFHFNNRKYADDDLIVGSTNPFELFLIFCELLGIRARRCHG